MQISENLSNNVLRKAAILINEALRLEIDLQSEGYLSENTSSGYVYIWLEDQPFTLYIDLNSDSVKALHTDSYNGSEYFTPTAGKQYSEIIEWQVQFETDPAIA